MPSRWASTGTRASFCTRSTRLLPPRGTIMSISPAALSIAPTAARSCVGSKLHDVGGNPAFVRALGERGMDRAVRIDRFAAAAQQRRIAGAHAQGRGIGGDVGAAFVDDPDQADRDAHARQHRARWGASRCRSLRRPDRADPPPLRPPRPSLRAAPESSRSRSSNAPVSPFASPAAISRALAREDFVRQRRAAPWPRA